MRARPRLRVGLLVGIAVLYACSIPWYRSSGGEASLWWGLPDWVAVALGCYVAVAVMNALAWLVTEIPDPLPEPESPGDAGPRSEPPA